jgi:glutamate synthase (NADPH/NADH) small chain
MSDIKESHRTEPLSIDLSQALFEASRCLFCYDAPCMEACPVHINIPGFIKRLAEQNFAGSVELLFEANPLATVCGLVCPTEDLCEGACVLPAVGQQPIRIGALQYFVASRFQEPELEPPSDVTGHIAVIGGGPSGIGCAVTLRRLGYAVDIFEREEELGGLVNQVIPGYRLPQEVVDQDLERLPEMGISLHSEEELTSERIAGLADQYDAIFLGVGMGVEPEFVAPGTDLPGVMQALEFLRGAREHAQGQAPTPELGKCVVVIGGGNVAMDAAVTAKHLGMERVIVSYRRSLEEMPAWYSEYMEAVAIGVEFRWLTTVKAIQGEGHVESVKIQPMRRTELGADDRRQVEPDPDAPTYEMPCTTVILALGQALDFQLAESLDLTIAAGRTIETDPETFQTNRPKFFAAGEAITGGSTVVNSLAQGMAAGRAIHQWLSE